MANKEWEQVKKIFYAALQREPAERGQFLSESCKDDDDLRREVESLLASSEDAGNFMQNQAVEEVAEVIAGNNEKLRANQSLTHYKILKLIGEGGMGEVYLAEDTHLNRLVALKLLAAHITEDETKVSRFRQEAFATSALNHPNIVTIHEIGNWQNRNFIATEFIDGMTLRSLLQKKKLPVGEILDITLQSASALEAAHGAGIVHRDIKPENIMIRPDGLVKVLDFGIAKYMPSKDGRKALVETEVGEIIGTAAYMSPEQARGLEIDSQTDIWSLGVILYEMIARKLPFPGETKSDRIAAILEHEPAPLTKTNRQVPPPLQQVVDRALAKNKKERYAEMAEMTKDLHLLRETTGDKPPSSFFLPARKSVASPRGRLFAAFALIVLLVGAVGFGYRFLANRPAGKKQIESIAVMPFINEGGNADVEYLSDGMTETLISSLSQLPNLNVKARSSVFRYKGKETNIQTIGKELNVQAVLNGRVVERDSDLSLYVEMVDVAADKVIWSQTYNRQITNLVSLQSDIARDVSNKLRTQLSGADEQRVAKTYTADPEAYQLYLQGLYHWNRRTAEDIRKSIALFQQAIDKDPAYAKAYAWLAMAYLIVPDYSQNLTKQELKEVDLKKRAALRQAQELDDSLVEVHAVLATLDEDAWDFPAAENEYKRAIELNPNFASAHHFYSRLLGALGRYEEAFAEINKAHELDPFSRSINFNIGGRFYDARRFDEAIAQYKRVLEMEPEHPLTHFALAAAYDAKGIYTEAIAEYRTADVLLEKETPENAERKAAALAEALKTGGAQGYWRKRLEFSRQEYDKGYGSAYKIAVCYARLGDGDRAFEQLEKSFAAREADLEWIKTDSAFDELSSDPRFQDLLRRIGLQT